MGFSIEWVPGGDNASAEERSTLCDLKVSVGDRIVSAFYDMANQEAFEAITLPAVHLAEGVAANWWRIFGGRDVTHRALHWRTGFALPDLRLEFDGSVLLVQCDPYESDNPQVLFMRGSTEYLARKTAEASLAALVDLVVHKLAGDGFAGSEVQLAWTRVQESRSNKAESAFCEAAGERELREETRAAGSVRGSRTRRRSRASPPTQTRRPTHGEVRLRESPRGRRLLSGYAVVCDQQSAQGGTAGRWPGLRGGISCAGRDGP